MEPVCFFQVFSTSYGRNLAITINNENCEANRSALHADGPALD